MNFDELKNKAKDLLGKNSDKVENAIDKGANVAKDRFGYGDKIDSASQKAKEYLSSATGEESSESQNQSSESGNQNQSGQGQTGARGDENQSQQ